MKKYFSIFGISGILLVALYFLIKKFKKKKDEKKDNQMPDLSDTLPKPKVFFKIDNTKPINDSIVDFIHLKEGGLSKDPSDPYAKYPTNVTHTNPKNKVTSDKWHTNKGVTYKVFQDLSAKLGYKGDAKTFYEMPHSVWFKIFSEGYYKPFKGFTKSELINLYLATWAWGSGVVGANSLLNTLFQNKKLVNDYIDQNGEAKLLEFLVKERIKFFVRLGLKKPTLQKFVGGWTNGALSFYWNFLPYAKS